MILFLSTIEDNGLETFAHNFEHKYKIPVKYISSKNMLKAKSFLINFNDEKVYSEIFNINFETIKICFINSNFFLDSTVFDFKNQLDKDYAIQEWNASLLALFGSQKKTKFINPYLSKYSFNSEIEQLLLLQQFELDTVEMFLSNDASDAIGSYHLWNKNLLIKEVSMGYENSRFFDKKQISNLKKLYLTPCIFQKGIDGENIEICIVGNDILAINQVSGNIVIPAGLKERLLNFCAYANLKIACFYAVLKDDKYYFYSLNQNPFFNNLLSSFDNNFLMLFENYLLREYYA